MSLFSGYQALAGITTTQILVKTQIAGSQPQSFWLSIYGKWWRKKFWAQASAPGDADDAELSF